MRAILMILSLFVISSCSGQKPSKTSLKIESLGFAFTAGAGGAVVFGYSDQGAKFTRVMTGSSVQEELPFGNWTLGIISWDGVGFNKPFTGETVCGFQTVDIKEQETSVTINVTNDECFNPNFTPLLSENTNFFKTTQVRFCESDPSSITNLQNCEYNPLTAVAFKRSFIGSYRIAINAGRTYGSQPSGETLLSDCYSASSNDEPGAGSTYTSSELNVPHFLPGVDLPIKVVAYLGGACETTMGEVAVNLNNSRVKQVNDLSPSSKKIYVQVPMAEICSVSNSKNLSNIAAGENLAGYPYVICNEKQLKYVHSMMDTTPFSTGYFILGADLDMSKFVKGGSDPFDACLEEGDTFIPLGKKYTTCSNLASYPVFNGVFDGNNFTISHLRFKKKDENNVGLFAHVQDGDIYNLTLSRADFEGSTRVGAAAGNAEDGDLINIRVTDSDIEGVTDVGGVYGWSDLGTKEQLHAKKMNIRGTTNVGGIAGSAGGLIQFASFSGIISGEQNPNKVGGIVGIGSSISHSASSGVIDAEGTNMGGIAGIASAASYTRSDMVIWDRGMTAPRNLGGIIGSGSGSIDRSFFYGSVSTSCPSVCGRGGLSGGTHAPTKSYSSFAASDGGVDGSPIYSLIDIWTSNFMDDTTNGVCNAAGTCDWSQALDDIPRLAFESTHPCTTPDNNESFATQDGTGTATNPYVICRPDQFAAINSFLGSHFIVKQNINVSGVSLGNFTGTIRGEGRILHSLQDLTLSASKALFAQISGGINNITLAGFKFRGTGCSNCDLANLALTNSGTIVNVNVIASKIGVNSSSAQIGGLVHLNTANGIINFPRVNAQFFNSDNIGGIAYENSGSIGDALVESIFNASNLPGAEFGGIVSQHYGTISRSLFKGRMENIDFTSDIGGIAVALYGGSILEDNEVGRFASIRIGSTTDVIGGIAAESMSPFTAIVRRNVNNSEIIIPQSNGNSDFGGLVGLGAFDNEGSLNLFPPLKEFDIVTSTASMINWNTIGANICRISFNGSAVVGNSFGGVLADNNLTRGQLTRFNTNDYYLDFPTSTSAACSSKASILNGAGIAKLVRPIETPSTYTISNLRTTFGYNVASLPTDLARVLAAYFAILKGETPVNPPIWEEDPEEGFRLFGDN